MVRTDSINVKLALFYLSSIGIIGWMLRMYSVSPYGIDYKSFLHAHSHTAFLGWIYIAFVVMINNMYIPPTKLRSKTYRWISLFTHFTVAGILVSFLLQGYGLFSILFLSLFLLSTYFYVAFFRRNKEVLPQHKQSFLFIRSALFFMLFSGLGPWLLGVMIKLFGKESAVYYDTIYFYLHFQYNAWFLFSLIGISLYFVEKQGVQMPEDKLKRLHYILFFSTLLSYFSNTLWAQPGLLFNSIAFAGVLGEWFGLFLLIRYLYVHRGLFARKFSRYQIIILRWVYLFLLLKASLQIFQVFPYFALVSYHIHNFIIGYLHLLMLGIFTPFLFIFLSHIKMIRFSNTWFTVFYAGFIINEIALFSHAIMIWTGAHWELSFPWILVFASSLLLAGMAGFFFRSLREKSGEIFQKTA